jgi:FMN phosphatase YigB (HAD superfamily)
MTRPAIVFDLGKVLVDFDYSIAARRIAARCSAPVDQGRFFADHAPLLSRYELGLVTTQEFFDHIRVTNGFAGLRDEFAEYFADIFTAIQPMVDLHAGFRGRGFRTYIFSNTNELAALHIRRRFPFFGHFDGYVLSYEHGAMKPDARLYEVLERETGKRGREIVYIDDRPENVAAGAARGWQAVLQESPEKTRAALHRLGLVNEASSASIDPPRARTNSSSSSSSSS